MKHPAYNLRPNKAVDRSLLVDRIRELEKFDLLNSRKCSYYGFGGPFLDDFRILSDRFPLISFHSLEKKVHTYQRQKFHRFSSHITLHHRNVDSFLANEDLESTDNLIWWLDYTNIGVNELRDITSLANCLSPGSLLRVTASANVRHDQNQLTELFDAAACRRALKAQATDFRVKIESYLPEEFEDEEIFDDLKFPDLCVRMIENALEQRNNIASTRVWHLVSRIYRDGAQMVTCEFYISSKPFGGSKIALKFLETCNSRRGNPEVINVPNLSIKERLFMEGKLPKNPLKTSRLASCLGYRIDDTASRHDEAILQFSKYHRHYPMLGKVSQ